MPVLLLTSRVMFQLSDIGLELLFALDRMMEKDVARLIQQTGDHQVEAVKHRAAVRHGLSCRH